MFNNIDHPEIIGTSPNPLKITGSFNPGKTKKSDISQLLFFDFFLFDINTYENQALIKPPKLTLRTR
jgi:hypothetical protein